jgi:hypothetical protein
MYVSGSWRIATHAMNEPNIGRSDVSAYTREIDSMPANELVFSSFILCVNKHEIQKESDEPWYQL